MNVMQRGRLNILAILVLELLVSVSCTCPDVCMCKRARGSGRGKDGNEDVTCTGLMEALVPRRLPSNTFKLDLSNNRISIIKKGDFDGLRQVRKLDLSNNRISTIEPDAFSQLENLRRLDLSNNNLRTIFNSSIFNGLVNLERLNLSFNQISRLPEACFNSLPKLKLLDFQSEYVLCDCKMSWLVKWKRDNNVKITNTTVCHYPESYRLDKVDSLKKKGLNCKSPLELPIFDMKPSTTQLVVHGDPIQLECRATYLDDNQHIVWVRNNNPLKTNHSSGITLVEQVLADMTMIESRVDIQSVKSDSDGIWECQVTTTRGSDTRHVTLNVLSDDTLFCEEVETTNNKGTFLWVETVAGVKVYIQCPFGNSSVRNYGVRLCKLDGEWQSADTSSCNYADNTTRELQYLAKQSSSISSGSQALALARKVQIQTSDAVCFHDKINIVFVAVAMEKMNYYTSQQLGQIMVSIASNIMEVDEAVLRAAQVSDRACSRIVQSLDKFASLTSTQSLTHYTPNILFETFNVTTPGFRGMTCAALRLQTPTVYGEDMKMSCNTANKTVAQFNSGQKMVEAVIQVPANILHGLSSAQADDKYTLYFFFYRNGKLFPTQGNNSALVDNNGKRVVGSYVISSKIAGHVVSNLSDPVVLTFPTMQGADPVAVYWDFNAHGSQGAWRSDGCVIVEHTANQSVVHCNHMTNFAVLLDVSVNNVDDDDSATWWDIGLLHPAIYIGCFICFVLVLFNLITYIIFCSKIRMKKRCLHAVTNISLGLLLLLIFFAGGINRSATPLICQIVGIGIHYTTLCTLLWIGISIRNIMKSLSREQRSLPPGETPLPPRPIVRFYFIGWGIPIIVVGITGAVNLENYGGANICWLDFKVSLLAFFFAVVIILLVQFVFIIVASIRIQRLPASHKYDTRIPSLHFTPEQTQITTASEQISQTKDSVRTVDTDQPFINDSESVATHQTAAVSVISSVLDQEHSYQKQLRGMVLLLFMYLLTWITGALAVLQNDFFFSIFSYVYGLMVTILGLYTVVLFCLMRNDVKYCWKVAFGCQKRHAIDPQMDMLSPVTANGNANGVCLKQSTSSLDSTFTNRSSNTNPSNPSFKSGSRRNTSKCNYVPAHTITDTSLQEDTSLRETPLLVSHDPTHTNGQIYNRYQFHQKRSRPKHYKYARYSQLSRDSSDMPNDNTQQPQIVWGGFHDSLSSAPESRMSALDESRDEMEARLNYTTGDASTLERSAQTFMLPQAYIGHNGHSSLPKMARTSSDNVRRKSSRGTEEIKFKRQSSKEDVKRTAMPRNTSRDSIGQQSSSKATTPDANASSYGISSYSANATVQEMHPLSKHLQETDDHKLGGNLPNAKSDMDNDNCDGEVFMITKELNGFALETNGHNNKETSV